MTGRFAALLLLVLAVAGCPAFGDETCAGDACLVVDSSGCGADATTPRCLNEGTAFFVSPKGDDGNEGTRARPFATVGAAIGKLDAAHRRIYVCEGTYREDFKLTTTHAGVGIFGGVTCAWAAAPDTKPILGATAHPVTLEDAQDIVLADLAITAAAATSGSSVAILAVKSSALLRSVVLTAGPGANGAKGTLQPFSFPAVGNGKTANAVGGGESTSTPGTCPGGGAVSKGGAGGGTGAAGSPGEPRRAISSGEGGTSSACGAGSAGQGGDGLFGLVPDLPPATTALGVGSAAGWIPQRGSSGSTGNVGGGGGGGFGGATGGGGGGAAGGCGGAGGSGGEGGGASIALASFGSTITIVTSELHASTAGSGGNGVGGQSGQGGGGGGGGYLDGCKGGDGGPGSFGAAGRGGAGGVSAGVLYDMTKPVIDAPTLEKIRFGARGNGGLDQSTARAMDGAAAPVLVIP